MSAEVIELHARRKREDRSACEARLFLVNMGLIPSEWTVLSMADNSPYKVPKQYGINPDTSPSEMIPYHGAGIDGVPFGGEG